MNKLAFLALTENINKVQTDKCYKRRLQFLSAIFYHCCQIKFDFVAFYWGGGGGNTRAIYFITVHWMMAYKMVCGKDKTNFVGLKKYVATCFSILIFNLADMIKSLFPENGT